MTLTKAVWCGGQRADGGLRVGCVVTACSTKKKSRRPKKRSRLKLHDAQARLLTSPPPCLRRQRGKTGRLKPMASPSRHTPSLFICPVLSAHANGISSPTFRLATTHAFPWSTTTTTCDPSAYQRACSSATGPCAATTTVFLHIRTTWIPPGDRIRRLAPVLN